MNSIEALNWYAQYNYLIGQYAEVLPTDFDDIKTYEGMVGKIIGLDFGSTYPIKVQFINHNKIDEKSFTFGELLFEQKRGIEN